jgi:tetratricopeptide (TPR) repeat protein
MDAAAGLLGEAADAADPDVSAQASFALAILECHRGALFTESERKIASMLARLEEEGASSQTLAEGYLAHAQLLFWNGRTSELAEVGKRAREHAIRAEDTLLEGQALTKIGVGLFYGTASWTAAEAHARASLADAERLGQGMLDARQGIAGALAAQGRLDEARVLYEQHIATLQERGQSFRVLSSRQAFGFAELVGREFERAETELRPSWDGLGLLGERGYRSTVGALLAETLAEQGRLTEAASILDEAEEIAGEDDWLTAAHARWSRALVASKSGEHDVAVVLAREAAEIGDAHEYFPTRAHYWCGLARVLVAAGQDGEAHEALIETQRLTQIKGTAVYAQRVRELLDELDAVR